jgi:hypothetical protein
MELASHKVVRELGRRWGVMMESETNGHQLLLVSFRPLRCVGSVGGQTGTSR